MPQRRRVRRMCSPKLLGKPGVWPPYPCPPSLSLELWRRQVFWALPRAAEKRYPSRVETNSGVSWWERGEPVFCWVLLPPPRRPELELHRAATPGLGSWGILWQPIVPCTREKSRNDIFLGCISLPWNSSSSSQKHWPGYCDKVWWIDPFCWPCGVFLSCGSWKTRWKGPKVTCLGE